MGPVKIPYYHKHEDWVEDVFTMVNRNLRLLLCGDNRHRYFDIIKF